MASVTIELSEELKTQFEDAASERRQSVEEYIRAALEKVAREGVPNEYVTYPPGYHDKTPAQRAAEFMEWANRPRPTSPGLPAEALRRENMYED